MPEDLVLDMGFNGSVPQTLQPSMVTRAADPLISPAYSLPTDYAAQYPIPLNTDEIVAMCEEITWLQALPAENTALKGETWRELNSLAFNSGSAYVSFADGECPEQYTHDGTNTSVTLKNIGAKKTLGISDIKQSIAIAMANWNGINNLIGPAFFGEGMPGAYQGGTFVQEHVASLKEKEIRLGMTLVMNGWDNLLVNGNSSSNSLQFDGLAKFLDGSGAEHVNDNVGSGTFDAGNFDRWLSEGCAKPDTLVLPPQAAQEMLSAYFQLGFAGSQVLNLLQNSNGGANRIIPGFNFAGFVNTGIGTLTLVADRNVGRTNIAGSKFQAKIYALRMRHNGIPLVYRLDQIPLSYHDLVPGCTTVSFMLWAKTGFILKHRCAHGVYTSQFNGRIVTTCPIIL